MDRTCFRNIYNVCFYLILFIIKILKIVKSREYLCPHDRKCSRPGFRTLGEPVSALL